MQADCTEAKKSFLIQDVFQRQVDLRLSSNTESSSLISTFLDSVKQDYCFKKEQDSALDCESALKDFEHLFSLKTEQIQKYGHVLSLNSNDLQRHKMVLGFLCIQKHRDKYPKIKQCGLAKLWPMLIIRESQPVGI